MSFNFKSQYCIFKNIELKQLSLFIGTTRKIYFNFYKRLHFGNILYFESHQGCSFGKIVRFSLNIQLTDDQSNMTNRRRDIIKLLGFLRY